MQAALQEIVPENRDNIGNLGNIGYLADIKAYKRISLFFRDLLHSLSLSRFSSRFIMHCRMTEFSLGQASIT